MERRTEVLGGLAGQDRVGAIRIKVHILQLLRKYGCLHLSSLRTYLRREKGVSLTIGTLHKYVKHLSNAGVLRIEKVKNPNRLYIYISDFSATEWLLQDMPCEKVNSDAIVNITYYLNQTKKNWNDIEIASGRKIMTLREYAPYILAKLNASGLEPFKQIILLNKVDQKISGNVTLSELNELMERELEQIDPISYESFKKLKKDFEPVNQLKNILGKYLPSRGFTAPNLEDLKKAIAQRLFGCQL